MSHMVSLSLFFFFPLITILVLSCCFSTCEARDSISVGDLLSESGETLVSAQTTFKLGFFTPVGNEGNRYLGIWYSKMPRTVVWVARRDTPLDDSCKGLGIADDGNHVQVWCDNGQVNIISLERSENSNTTLQLLDSGNLVLIDGDSRILWESFKEPTDTFLPGMNMSDGLELTSWASQSDPRKGDYLFREELGVYIIQNRSTVYWKSDPGMFSKQKLLPDNVDQMLTKSIQAVSHRTSLKKIIYKQNFFNYSNSRLTMNYSGEIQFSRLVDDGSWESLWSAPKGNCGVYKRCGSFGICSERFELCRCPPGYRPASEEDWKRGRYDGGCERESTTCSRNPRFMNLLLTTIGGQMTPYDQAEDEEECRKECSMECSCVAYSFRNSTSRTRRDQASDSKCYTWTAELVFYDGGTDGVFNLSLRIPTPSSKNIGDVVKPKSDSRKNNLQRMYVIVITCLIAGIILSISGFILYLRRRRPKLPGYNSNAEAIPSLFSNDSGTQVNNLMHENGKLIDVPFYDLESILSATDNFSDANKLGQGGFGPVYKGTFSGAQEIAVKRLSSCSGQGIEEFLNEIVLIAKLQHRNLVRLLGYCIKGGEKILLYEYMPNRSLDAFIFDQHNSLLLDWKKRFDIIMGISRGLLYLHQDSRLRIIHRDLKTSNILLDEDMNPKISDFGLARIVEGKGTEANTNRVVGTYGYMSPEYALDGKFSIKSDVFSFGVVMLEIISGRKNTGFYNPKQVLNLLGYAWRLWCDNKALDIIDPMLLESCEESEVMKCINIGLLCVQEDPNARPPMSAVVIMMGSETNTLPLPTQPAFVVRRRLSSTSSSSSAKQDSISVNELSISMAQGR